MNLSQLLAKLTQYVSKMPQKVAKALPDAGSAIRDKINKVATPSNAAKITGGLIAANQVDSMIVDVPVANNVYKWMVTTWDDVYESTVRKIPVVGDWLRKCADFINRLVIPKAQDAIEKHRAEKVNDPKFYEHTDMHQAWSIPFNYPDTEPLVFGPGVVAQALEIVRLGYNPAPDLLAVQSRTTQMLDLLKGVRGLSGQLPYSNGDLFFYSWVTDYLINEYCRLKFALKAARCYIMTKARMPKNLLAGLGWNPEDFINNRALYVDLLAQLGSFITNSWPVFGVQWKRITGLWDKLIPDCNDGKVATLIKIDVLMNVPLFTSTANSTHRNYTSHFSRSASSSAAVSQLDYVVNTNVTFANYSANMQYFLDEALSNPHFTALRGDIIGTFGKSAVWCDGNINSINITKVDDLVHEFDELFLTQLQNATYVMFYPSSSGVADPYYATRSNNVGITFGTHSNGMLDMPTVSTNVFYTDDKLIPVYSGSYFGSSGTDILIPPTDGFKGYQTSSSTGTNIPSSAFTNESVVVANKYKMSEAEQIEIIQLTSFAVAGRTNGADSQFSADLAFVTNTLYLAESVYLYYSGSQDRQNTVCAIAYNTAPVPNINKVITAWAQTDYGIKLPIVICATPSAYNTNPDTYTSLLLDINIMGSMSLSAFKQAVRYANYSLKAPDIKITEVKKINNIVDVYNIK